MSNMLGTTRFDVVVWNYDRLNLFFENVGRLHNLDPDRDRVTVVSCSPSASETQLVADYATRLDMHVRYLTRHNRGIDQLARCEYFTGRVGDLSENLASWFTLQMQEHYLAPDDPSSRWGVELNFSAKGDTIPDGVIFDLDVLEQLIRAERVDAIVADRNNPCFVRRDGASYIAPNGGNFAIRTELIGEAHTQRQIKRIADVCDDTYSWALYAEYMWGLLFFPEGRRVYDLKRRRLFTHWTPADFYESPDDYNALFASYQRMSPARATLRRLRQGLVRSMLSS